MSSDEMNEMEIFSQEWSEALEAALNANEAFRRESGDWQGSLVFALRLPGGATGSGTFVDLEEGRCRLARRAGPGEIDGADYLLRADATTWGGLLSGSADPIFSIMTGRLELARGSAAGLLPHASAAKQLVLTAAGLGGRFPEA